MTPYAKKALMQAVEIAPLDDPHKRLRFILAIGLISIVAIWAHFHFTNAQVNDDPTTALDLAAAKEEAQPFLDALEKYHADRGLYPARLDQLNPGYAASTSSLRSYRYSARHEDWVFKSADCAAREKSLRGWVLKEAKEYAKEVMNYKLDCINGYRAYQLQSHDFPGDAQTRYIDRWAYYDSSNQQWTVGWCSHNRARGSSLGINGVCRWAEHHAPNPW